MAEIIQERVEDRLPELQQLERTGLFSQMEIRWERRKEEGLGRAEGRQWRVCVGGGYRGSWVVVFLIWRKAVYRFWCYLELISHSLLGDPSFYPANSMFLRRAEFWGHKGDKTRTPTGQQLVAALTQSRGAEGESDKRNLFFTVQCGVSWL